MRCDEIPLLELIRGELDREEARAIVAHLEQCRTCRERAAVMTVLETCPEVRSNRPQQRWTFLAAAALLAVLVGVSLARWGPGGTGQIPEQWVVGSPYPYLPLETRGQPSGPVSENRDRAFQSYRNGDFEGAARRLQLLPPSPEREFYLGVSLYLDDRPEEAETHLRNAAQLSSRWKGPALWYLAGAHLKRGRIEAARVELEEVVELKGEFATEAAGLLERIAPLR